SSSFSSSSSSKTAKIEDEEEKEDEDENGVRGIWIFGAWSFVGFPSTLRGDEIPMVRRAATAVACRTIGQWTAHPAVTGAMSYQSRPERARIDQWVSRTAPEAVIRSISPAEYG